MFRPKMRQSGRVADWSRMTDQEHAELVGLLRGLRPWGQWRPVRDGLYAWARGGAGRGACMDVADMLARIGRGGNLTAWTDGAVAALTADMLGNAAAGHPRIAPGGSLLGVRSLPRSTRYRNQDEGMAYLYRRRRREANLRELIVGGRSPAAARQWLLRHSGEPVQDASPPQHRRVELDPPDNLDAEMVEPCGAGGAGSDLHAIDQRREGLSAPVQVASLPRGPQPAGLDDVVQHR